MATAELKGYTRIVKKLKRIERAHDRLGPFVENWIDNMEKQATYGPGSNPVQPPGSSYERTFTLQRSRRKGLSKTKTGVVGWLRWTANYAIWVIGEGRQAGIHAGRWWTVDGILRKNRRQIVAGARRLIARLLAER